MSCANEGNDMPYAYDGLAMPCAYVRYICMPCAYEGTCHVHFSMALAFVFSHFRSVHQSFSHKLNVDLKMAIFHQKNWGGQDSVSVSKSRDPVSPDSKSRDQNISRL